MRALLLAALLPCVSVHAGSNKVLDAEQRFVDLSNRIRVEHDRAQKALIDSGYQHPLFEAEIHLESLSQELNAAEIVVAMQKDEAEALHSFEVDYLEISGRLAAYRELVGSKLSNVAGVQAGLKTLFAADAEANILKADILEAYAGGDRFAVVAFPDGTGKLELRVFAPKGMPASALDAGIQKSTAKRSLPVKVFDLPDFEP